MLEQVGWVDWDLLSPLPGITRQSAADAVVRGGWGTWIRTKAFRVRVGSSTAKLSPSRAAAGRGGELSRWDPGCNRHEPARGGDAKDLREFPHVVETGSFTDRKAPSHGYDRTERPGIRV